MTDFRSLTDVAVEWLRSGLRPIEEYYATSGELPDEVTIKFTWNEQDYEVGVRKLRE